MKKYIPNSSIGVTGKMNAHDAGFVGRRLALAAVMVAASPLVLAVGKLLHWVRWW